MFVGLERTTLVNFPGKVSCAIFLPGCNMRCGFCHNSELVLASVDDDIFLKSAKNVYYSIEDVFSFLQKRRGVLSGVVLSGGEPFASPNLFSIIERIKRLGFALKIDTNGLFPKRLAQVLQDSALSPQMVALDIKTSPDRYIELMPSSIKNGDEIAKKLIESIHILQSFKLEHKDFSIDYRTVLVPNLVGEREIKEMASLIQSDSIWHFAEFVSGNCLNPEWDNIVAYTKTEIDELVALAKTFVPNSSLR